jgi:hypothetical protein
LFGFLFFVPSWALLAKFTDVRLDDGFIREKQD